jgi:type I restriction enzyme S subunit
MKQGWEIKKLGEVADVGAGNSAPQKKELFEDGTHPFIRTSDVGQIRKGVILNSVDNLNSEGIKGLKLHKKGTILFPKSGASTFLNHRVLMEIDGYVSSHLATIKANAKVAVDKYLLYYLITVNAKDLMQDIAYPSLKTSDIGLIPVPLPPLPEQQRIVSILDESFAAIDKAKANADQNLKNAKELFESYLQGVFEKKGDGWEEKIIKEVCELKSGTTISTNLERTEGDVLYVKVGDMTLPENDVDINTSSRFVNRNEIKLNQIIPNGAIIFPKRGGAIATNKKRKIVKPTIVDLNTMAIIPSNKIDANYFFHWFQLIDLNSISNGTSIPQINNYSFDEVKIPFPKSLKEQQTIVRQLDALRAETQKLEAVYQKKIADLDELKKSILQKAFTGELKTEKIEII